MSARSMSARPLAVRCAVLLVALAACGGDDEAARLADSLRADSARAVAAADSARLAEQLTQVDTALAPSLHVDLAEFERRPSGLYVRELRRGSGAVADSGKWVTVDYTTWLADGTVVDDTRKEGGEPQNVLLGYGRVIKG
ncbi:MAG TPA: FKBP-type peptidyl-prolyl cis-trans isomerase, partial [Gemmatimonadaceae bacterium]|nr:FKBP-type peptidyl-prolyl cis-trans isomerase [Gemmatimonadaceae bacterium]